MTGLYLLLDVAAFYLFPMMAWPQYTWWIVGVVTLILVLDIKKVLPTWFNIGILTITSAIALHQVIVVTFLVTSLWSWFVPVIFVIINLILMK